MTKKAEIGIFGGSGFYSFLNDVKEIKIETPYGSPSDLIAIGKYNDKKIAFLPRHGKLHQYPPHKIPYKANLWAMKSLGVERIIAPTAVGSLQPNVKVGDFIITSQFVDRTSGRDCTFYEGPITVHVSLAEPYCPELRKIAVDVMNEMKLPFHPTGTVVVIQGPRFSTKAESEWFTKMGWDIINMTQYPEVLLARELEMCYVNIAVVTDYDAGVVASGNVEPVTQEVVVKKFAESNSKLVTILKSMIEKIPEERHCQCGKALTGARVEI
ncbi:MAG: S-methyl-5'-thioadenosine phosphorylase [Caldisericaceae bacterium]|nr:S-methyl-5'-thioadenosine phosphorylase [Caldisericaceae bacterium]